MDATANTPPDHREVRFAACLERLEGLKAINARREILEEQVLLEFLRANRTHLHEFPLLETEQKSLIDMLLRRAEGRHPGFEFIRDRFVAYLVELNHYGKAKAVGDAAATERLCQPLERAELILAKCLQGAIYASSLIKDNFSDAVIRHFGEASLDKIDELTTTLFFDEAYWRSYIETFIKEEVRSAYPDILAEHRFRLARDGQMLVVAFPFDAVLDKIKGTTKAISQTRVQVAFDETTNTEEGRLNIEAALSVLTEADIPQWVKRPDRDEMMFTARIASLDSVVPDYRNDTTKDDDEDLAAIAKRALLEEQIVALCIGAEVSLQVIRADFARALREFSSKERVQLVTMAESFDAVHLGMVIEHIMEFDFANLLREKGEADAGRIQIKSTRQRRARRETVLDLTDAGLNKVRRKQLFDDDPDNPEFYLFHSQKAAEMEDRLRLLQIEPDLNRSLTALWDTASYKVDLYVCINLVVLGKVSPNLPARLTEILGRYGITLSGAPETT